MSFMKLAPETVRLRRIAKAYAAGEFSRFEYRQARREVIETFAETLGGRNRDVDDTRPRWHDAGPVAEHSQTVVAATGFRLPSWVGACLFLAVLLFAVNAWADVLIAPVNDRDPNPARSPRIAVVEVAIGNVEPLAGIDAEDLERQVTQKLGEFRRKNGIEGHGFTATELQEVGRFLNTLGGP